MYAQATALEITPYDLMPKGDPIAFRRSLFGRKPAVKQTKPKQVRRALQPDQAPPSQRTWSEQHDSHMAAYLEWKGNEPLGFLKLKCREMGISFADATKRSRKHAVVKPRHILMCEVKRQYPTKSLPEIGRLFGGFDHTTVLNALRKAGMDTENRKPCAKDEAEKIRSMLLAGKTQSEIAALIGFSQSAVNYVIKRNGWKPKSYVRRIADHADEVRRMFDAGYSYARMSRTIDFGPNNIARFCKRMGWTR